MDVLISLLTIVCLICLVIGLFKPDLVLGWSTEEKRNRKNVLKYYGIGLFILLVLFSATVDSSSEAGKENLGAVKTVTKQAMTEDEKAAANLDKMIVDLGAVDSITPDNLYDVQEVRADYEELTSSQKVLVTKLSVLTEMEKRIQECQSVQDESTAENSVSNNTVNTPIQTQPVVNDQETKVAEPQSQNNEYTVYITRTGEKYHLDGCRYLRQSKIAISKSDAINQGYSPCSVCNP